MIASEKEFYSKLFLASKNAIEN